LHIGRDCAPGDGVVAVLEGGQPVLYLVKIGEVVGRHDLALHDGEEDFTWFNQEACTGVWTMTASG
jgi:hypothetical protein